MLRDAIKERESTSRRAATCLLWLAVAWTVGCNSSGTTPDERSPSDVPASATETAPPIPSPLAKPLPAEAPSALPDAPAQEVPEAPVAASEQAEKVSVDAAQPRAAPAGKQTKTGRKKSADSREVIDGLRRAMEGGDKEVEEAGGLNEALRRSSGADPNEKYEPILAHPRPEQ